MDCHGPIVEALANAQPMSAYCAANARWPSPRVLTGNRRCDNPPEVEFRILGPLEIVDDGRELTLTRPKQRALLGLLLLRPNQVVAIGELLEALWGDQPPETAPTALYGHVSALRKLLGSHMIETRPPGYLLRLDPGQVDLYRLEALVEEARGEPNVARRRELLRAALLLFRGEALSDLRYETFARDEAARIEDLRRSVVEERIEADLELGGHTAVIPELERLVAANPLRERLCGQLMLALYRAGRQAEALGVYQEGRRILAEELGLDPGPALQQLARGILAQDPLLGPPESAVATQPRARRERKLISVLLCDLAARVPASLEEPDPEDMEALLEPLAATVRATLARFGGTAQTFAGATAMGVFGAPVGHEDDPERAVRAALAIRDALAERIEVRIAVDTGTALVTLDAGQQPGEAVVGDVVGTAARLLHAAPANGVIVGEPTYRSSAHAISYRDARPVVAHGQREPLRAWEAVAARSKAAPRRPRAELVGRGRELDQLADTLARAAVERAAQLVTIVGVPGIGKTRLVRELYALVEAAPWSAAWLEGRSLPYGDGVTFWALGEIVKAQAGIFEGDPPAAVVEKLRLAVEATLADERERGWVLRHLRALLGLGDARQTRDDARGEAFAAWRLFLEALADRGPLVLVVEDLHWADEDLLDFVDELTTLTTDTPLLVVATSRPELLERRPSWGGGKRNATTISLAPLSDAETERLLGSLLGGAVSAELVRRAQGNPLYAEEYARLVLERGERGEHLPESLQALIAARLDALPVEEKLLVQDAAIVGEVAWAGAVAALGGRGRAAVEELARPLERKELLRRRRRSSVEGETEFAFHHVLVRDVAYAQIPRRVRGMKHRLAAEWISSLGRREDHVELLAHHYLMALELARATGGETAELGERTRLALRDAGDRAATLHALPAAARFYMQALALWPPEDPERARLLLRQGRALVLSEVSGEEELLAAASALLAAGDRQGAAVAEALLISLHQEQGRGELVRQRLDRVGDLVAGLPPSPQVAEVMAELCRSRMMSAQYEEAIRIGDEALALCERLGLDEIAASVLISVGPCRLDLSSAEEAITDLEQGTALARGVSSPEAARGYGNLHEVYMVVGNLPAAYQARRAGTELAERFGLRLYLRWLRIEALEELYLTGGHWDELLARSEEFLDEPSVMAITAHDLRARVHLGRGDIRGALAGVGRMLELVKDTRDPQVHGNALAVTAFVKLCAGQREATTALVDKLLERTDWGSPSTYLYITPLFGVVLHTLGRADALERRVVGVRVRTPWLQAGVAAAAGDFAGAADVYERIGARPDEAYARLKAAGTLLAQGRGGEASAQLEPSFAFFRAVGATAYEREARGLLTLLG
jgi:DNA-binding SARP family transcriptional activator